MSSEIESLSSQKISEELDHIIKTLQDENNDLKMRISELEFEIIELRVTPDYPL